MIHRRERFPYEWQIALSGALLVGMSTVLPSTPFSGLLTLWSQWIGEPLLGWHLGGGFPPVFLPLIAALALSYPILAFCDQVLERPQYFAVLARITVVLMFLLSGMAIVNVTLTIGTPLEIGQITVACGIGILLVMFGVRLHRKYVLSPRIRLLGVTLSVAGVCIATFVLLPVGLLALFVTYIVLAIVLAQREHTCISPARPR